ncbi:hypothetical protein D3C71_1061770 [compost metagenome]
MHVHHHATVGICIHWHLNRQVALRDLTQDPRGIIGLATQGPGDTARHDDRRGDDRGQAEYKQPQHVQIRFFVQGLRRSFTIGEDLPLQRHQGVQTFINLLFGGNDVLFQLRHRGIKSALPDQHLHLGECVDVSLAILFQGSIGGLAFRQIEQRLEGFQCQADTLFGGIDGLLHLLIVFVDQQVPGVPGVVPYTCGNDHDRIDFRPVPFDDQHGLFL